MALPGLDPATELPTLLLYRGAPAAERGAEIVHAISGLEVTVRAPAPAPAPARPPVKLQPVKRAVKPRATAASGAAASHDAASAGAWLHVARPRWADRSERVRPPPTPPRTKWTRRVPHLVLIGHAASLTPY